jgi:hypothetical protein
MLDRFLRPHFQVGKLSEPFSVPEPHHVDAVPDSAPAPGKESYAALASAPLLWLTVFSTKLKVYTFDAAPAPESAMMRLLAAPDPALQHYFISKNKNCYIYCILKVYGPKLRKMRTSEKTILLAYTLRD